MFSCLWGSTAKRLSALALLLSAALSYLQAHQIFATAGRHSLALPVLAKARNQRGIQDSLSEFSSLRCRAFLFACLFDTLAFPFLLKMLLFFFFQVSKICESRCYFSLSLPSLPDRLRCKPFLIMLTVELQFPCTVAHISLTVHERQSLKISLCLFLADSHLQHRASCARSWLPTMLVNGQWGFLRGPFHCSFQSCSFCSVA